MGATGCGKSTIAKLFMRLYDPPEGKVLIDGQEISKFDPASLYRQISIVPQEGVLFARTIRENILYGMNPDSVSESGKLN